MNVARSLPWLTLALLLTLAPPPAAAQVVSAAPEAVGQSALTGVDTVQPETALGAWAAVGCGIMVRATILTGGTQVGTIAGAVACCAYALFDALYVDPR